MIKKVCFIALLLSSLTAAAMEPNEASSNGDSDKQLVVCAFAPEHDAGSENEDSDIVNCDDIKKLTQAEIDELIASQAIDLYDSETPLSPFYWGKIVVNGAYKAAKFGYQYPYHTGFFVCYLASAAVAAAVCDSSCCASCLMCQCHCNGLNFGKAPDMYTCVKVCNETGRKFSGCIWEFKETIALPAHVFLEALWCEPQRN